MFILLFMIMSGLLTVILHWTVTHRDLSHFELRNTTATDPTILIFERIGLDWKLVRVQIPQSLL